MEVGVETWRVFKHGEGSILFPDEQLAPTLENLASRIQILRAPPPPPSFNPLLPPLLLNQLYRARILMEHYISVENIIFYFRFVLEKKKKLLAMLRRIEEFSELFDGGKSVGFGIKFGIFFLPLRYVPWKIFFDFCFCSTNELQL